MRSGASTAAKDRTKPIKAVSLSTANSVVESVGETESELYKDIINPFPLKINLQQTSFKTYSQTHGQYLHMDNIYTWTLSTHGQYLHMDNILATSLIELCLLVYKIRIPICNNKCHFSLRIFYTTSC